MQRTGESNTGLVGISAAGPVLEGALRRRRRQELLEALRSRFRTLFDWFDTELDWAPARPGPARKALAFDRVLTPFYGAEESGGIELDWRELIGERPTMDSRSRERGLYKLLKLGMQREVLLLQRLPDSIRARRISSRDWSEDGGFESLLRLTMPRMTPENIARPFPSHYEPFYLSRQPRGRQKPSEGAPPETPPGSRSPS